jgi:hypothetical protein
MAMTVALSSTATIANPAFLVRVVAIPETINDMHTLAIDWNIVANESELHMQFGSGIRLAYDNTVLQLISYSGSVADYSLTETLTGITGAGKLGVYEVGFFEVRACLSADGTVGFVTIELGHPDYSYHCPVDIEVTLASIRFAFRESKTQADLRNHSIRLMTIEELEYLKQSVAVNIFTACAETETYFEYVYRSRYSTDSLNAPDIRIPVEIRPQDLNEENIESKRNIQVTTDNDGDVNIAAITTVFILIILVSTAPVIINKTSKRRME